MLVPANFWWPRCEGFRPQNLQPLGAPGHHRLEPSLLALLFSLHPHFGHGMIGAQTHLQLLERATVWLCRKTDPVFVAPLCQPAVVVVRKEIADGAPEIP